MILLHDLKGAMQFHNRKTCLCQLWFHCINARCMEVLVLIRHVFLSPIVKMNDQFIEQQINITFCGNYHWRWNTVLSIWSQKQVTNFAMEIAGISMIQESLHVEITNEDNDHHFCRYQGYCSLWIHSTRPVNQAYYVEILKQLSEAVKGLNFGPTIGLSIMTMLQPTRCSLSSNFWSRNLFPWFGSEWLLAVSKNKACVKGTKISGYWRHPKKMWWQHWKLFHNRSSKNVSNSGSTSKVTPLSKL